MVFFQPRITGKMFLQPVQSFSEAAVVQVNDQINGSAATASMVPVDELGPVDREDSPAGMPLGPVERIGAGSPEPEHRFQSEGLEAAQLSV